MASIERKLGLKRSNHVAGGLLTAFLRSGEEARLESPFSSSPRKSAGFSPPGVVGGPCVFLDRVHVGGGGLEGIGCGEVEGVNSEEES